MKNFDKRYNNSMIKQYENEIQELLKMLLHARPAVLAASRDRMTVGGDLSNWQKLAEKIDEKIGNVVGPDRIPRAKDDWENYVANVQAAADNYYDSRH
jgi:hypothetical protein